MDTPRKIYKIDNSAILFINSTSRGVYIEYVINNIERANHIIPSEDCTDYLCQLMDRLDEGNDVLSIWIKESDRMIKLEIRKDNILKLMESLYVHKYSKFHDMLYR